jgi:type I restriction enzyme, S subunit
MEVKPGYMMTEVGVIPEDWKVHTLSDVSRKITDGDHVTPMRASHGYYLLSARNVLNGRIDVSDVDYVGFAEYQRMKQRCGPEAGDILISCSGTIGRIAVVPVGFECVLVRSAALAKIKTDLADGVFLQFWLQSSKAQWQIASSVNQGAQPNLFLNHIERLICPLPPLLEQRTIAAALRDVEALLEGLDRLIAKKRDLKQAAMQQLLTGTTRLTGFSGEWEEKRLGAHVAFLRNGVNSRAELLPEGRVKYLHYGDIHASKKTYLSPESLPAIPDVKATRLDRLQDGDLVFADASEDLVGVCKSVEMKGIGTTEVVPGQHTIAVRFDKTVLADGFKGFLQFCPQFATHLRRLAAGTKVYATNRAYISSVEMRLPPVTEQSAIANVLSDMDVEIAALEARRDKTRDLKQAMMQELLTGKTRLV